MASSETRDRLQRQIDELSRRMHYDANDLDYETHLNQKRQLQRILDRIKEKANEE